MQGAIAWATLAELARTIVEKAAPARARLPDPKDPRFSLSEIQAASEALLRWARTLVENTPKAEEKLVDGVPDRGPGFVHTISISMEPDHGPRGHRWLVDCTCGWWTGDRRSDEDARDQGHAHLDAVARVRNPGGPAVPDIRCARCGGPPHMRKLDAPDDCPDRTQEPLADRIATIASEAFGPFPVQTAHESLTAIEKGIHQQRMVIGSYERGSVILHKEHAALTARIAELEKNLGRTTTAEFDPPHDINEHCPSRPALHPHVSSIVGRCTRCDVRLTGVLAAAPAAPAKDPYVPRPGIPPYPPSEDTATKEAWHYSSNEEWFQSDACDSREAAIAEGLCELGLAPEP